jgi:hypothetical protein
MDDRTYIRLHDGMPDHPKVVGLSDAAFRLYVEAMCWCSRYLTDGVLKPAALRHWAPRPVRELTEVGLIEHHGSPPGPERWLIHDYTEHQRTAVQVAEAREVKRSAGVTGNHERWHVSRNFFDPSCALCAIDDASHVRSLSNGSPESQMRSLSDPDRSQETETDTENRKKKHAQCGSDQDPDFTAFWLAYPRKIGKGQARKAWRSAVLGRRTEAKTVIVAAELYRDACRASGTEQQYIPYPATWLNGERYNDSPEITTPRRSGPSADYDWEA